MLACAERGTIQHYQHFFYTIFWGASTSCFEAFQWYFLVFSRRLIASSDQTASRVQGVHSRFRQADTYRHGTQLRYHTYDARCRARRRPTWSWGMGCTVLATAPRRERPCPICCRRSMRRRRERIKESLAANDQHIWVRAVG